MACKAKDSLLVVRNSLFFLEKTDKSGFSLKKGLLWSQCYSSLQHQKSTSVHRTKESVMFTMVAESTRKTFSAVTAVAIVSFGGLAMDQAHLAAAPRGTIEIGELTALGDAGTTLAQLPEVVVYARRESPTYFAAAQLPEIVVVAKRVAHMVAQEDKAERTPAPAISAGI